jgi:hypothetical protein
MGNTISVLDTYAYKCERESIRENNTSLVHLADIHTTKKGATQAFVKIFPEKSQPNGLIKEATGYILANEAGLPVADEAYLALIDNRILESVHPKYKNIIRNNQGVNIAWVTTAIKGTPIRYLQAANEPNFKERLKKSKILAKLLAFDEFTGNIDRNKDNLIIVENGKIALIDHADIGGGINNLNQTMDPNSEYENVLMKNLFGSTPPNQITSGMIFAAEKFSDILDKTRKERERICKIIYRAYGIRDNNQKIILDSFLEERAKNGPERLRRKYNILL